MTSEGSSADYVIVGAGTAGCVLAHRLSVDPNVRVTLLELGGPDSSPAIYDPKLTSMFSLWDPKAAENWGYTTTPQPGLSGRAIDIARGKVLGGCSSVNAMIYIRGNRRDFDRWSRAGNRGWSYEEVLPYFKKSETYHGPASAYHGENGPLPVIDYQKPSVASGAFIEAAATLGHTSKYNDFNGTLQEGGAGLYQSTRTLEGIRASAASAFIKPIAPRRNLQLLLGVRASRLLIEGGQARGVEYTTAQSTRIMTAEREVILACGAFETPKLLMLSGIGPAEQLNAFDIPVVVNLKGVGANLQDQLLLGVGFESLVPFDPPELLAEAGLFMWSDLASEPLSPDLQFFFGPVQFMAPEYTTQAPGFTFAPILVQPHSRGTVSLAARDPTVLARVDPRYLSDDEDLALLEFAIRYSRELAHTAAFDTIRGRELGPGEAVTTSSEIRAYIRRVAGTVWHPVGTCKMGPDSDATAVVDSHLRVRGIERLRVVDASVMPTLVNGNPNAAIMMIAEKAADLIRCAASPGVPPLPVEHP